MIDENMEHEIEAPLMEKANLDHDDPDDTSLDTHHDQDCKYRLHQRNPKLASLLRRRGAQASFVLNIVLTLLCSVLVVINVVLRWRNYDIFAHIPLYSNEVIYTDGIAPPLLGPEFQKKTVVFQRNESFMYEKSKAYPAWHEILHVARHGRVAFDSRPGEFFGIGGYHELHCVWLLQQAVDLAANGPRLDDELQIDHMYHCAEFLRQSVMCHADNTIERRFEGILGPFSANNTHVCGNWNALMQWSNDHIYTGPYLNPHTKLPP